MRAGHVRDLGGIAAAAGEPGVDGDDTMLEDHLDGRCGEARLDVFVDQLIGHAVEVVSNLDVIVDVDATAFPFRELVAGRRQRLECGPVDLVEECPPTHADAWHRPLVDRVDPLANGRIEIREREEGLVP